MLKEINETVSAIAVGVLNVQTGLAQLERQAWFHGDESEAPLNFKDVGCRVSLSYSTRPEAHTRPAQIPRLGAQCHRSKRTVG